MSEQSNVTGNVVSIFSGAGGFDAGFKKAGFSTVLACELLPDAARTLSNNLGGEIFKVEEVSQQTNYSYPLILQGDIRTIEFSKFKLEPDVLIGGPPCQDFSRVKGGTETGLNGRRGKLYVQFVRALMYFQPKVFVFENVPGLVSSNKGNDYKIIRKDFQQLESLRKAEHIKSNGNAVPSSPIFDYEIVFSEIVDAVKLGIPQYRRRLITIGVRKDFWSSIVPHESQRVKKNLFQILRGEKATFRKFPITTLEIFEGKPLNQLQAEYKKIMTAYEELASKTNIPATPAWLRNHWNNVTFDIVRDYLNFYGFDYNDPQHQKEFSIAMTDHKEILEELGYITPVHSLTLQDNTNQLPNITAHVQERMKQIPPDMNYKFVDGTRWAVKGREISFIYRRSSPLKPAWTVLAYGGGGTHGYHYERNRSQLTMREKARIQTFEDNFTFHGNSSEIRAQIGEAVPPLLGKIIGTMVKEILEIGKGKIT